MEAIEREVAFATRHHHTLSLVMFDIDHFKQVNDNFGHSMGDAALQKLCIGIQDIIRKEDIFARYGGEEFALLLRNTSSEMAFILAERMRRSAEKLDLRHEDQEVPITISLGISSTSEAISTAKELITTADQRLYRAKHGGRNRTEAQVVD